MICLAWGEWCKVQWVCMTDLNWAPAQVETQGPVDCWRVDFIPATLAGSQTQWRPGSLMRWCVGVLCMVLFVCAPAAAALRGVAIQRGRARAAYPAAAAAAAAFARHPTPLTAAAATALHGYTPWVPFLVVSALCLHKKQKLYFLLKYVKSNRTTWVKSIFL